MASDQHFCLWWAGADLNHRSLRGRFTGSKCDFWRHSKSEMRWSERRATFGDAPRFRATARWMRDDSPNDRTNSSRFLWPQSAATQSVFEGCVDLSATNDGSDRDHSAEMPLRSCDVLVRQERPPLRRLSRERLRLRL